MRQDRKGFPIFKPQTTKKTAADAAETQIQNPKKQIPNHKKIPINKFQITNKIPNPKSQIINNKSQITNPKFQKQILNPKNNYF